jgi:hypothetical protein
MIVLYMHIFKYICSKVIPTFPMSPILPTTSPSPLTYSYCGSTIIPCQKWTQPVVVLFFPVNPIFTIILPSLLTYNCYGSWYYNHSIDHRLGGFGEYQLLSPLPCHLTYLGLLTYSYYGNTIIAYQRLTQPVVTLSCLMNPILLTYTDYGNTII